MYSAKVLLRPRDYADLLLSWAHMLNIVIYDFPSGLARHMNLRVPETMTFTPHEGRLAPPTTRTFNWQRKGLSKLTEKKNPPEENSHPLTGSSEHYALSDTIHEKKSKDLKNALRRVGLVPELSGQINTQVVEQFFSQIRKCNYFLNMASPSTNIFLLRNTLHHWNERHNKNTIVKIKNTFGKEVLLNAHGQRVLGL